MKSVLAIVMIFTLSMGALLSGPTMAHAASDTTSAAAVAAAMPVDLVAISANHFNVDAATEAYMAQLSPQARANSDAYFEGGYWLVLWDCLWSLAVAWLLLGTRLSVRMRNFAERLTRFRWLQTAIYAVQYIMLMSLLTLPWTFYEGYVREHRYGLSTQNFPQWFGDQFKALIIGLILGTIALVIVYAVIRRANRTWWLWGSLVVIVFAVMVSTIAPVYIAPVFNTYKSLPDSALKSQILSMARANGIPATDVYEFDASKQSRRISANVSGMFGTTRISLNDNLMNRSTPAEIKGVLGHEMGHYVMNHVYKGTVFFAIIIVIGFALVRWGFGWAERRWGTRWGLRGVGDVAGLPLLAALFTLYLFLLTPVNNTITRTMESEADAFGLNAARQPDGFAEAAVQLSEYRKLHPGPIEEFIFFDHPSTRARIHDAMRWREAMGTP